MRAFGMDLRVRIFDACQAGGTTAEVAEQFAVSTAFVRRLKQRHRENGSIGPKPGGRGRTPVLAAERRTRSVRPWPPTRIEHRPSTATTWASRCRCRRSLGPSGDSA